MKKPKKTKAVKPRIYNAMIDQVIQHKDGSVSVQMSLFGSNGIIFKEMYTTRPIKETNPDAGQQRFFVLSDRLTVYTSIGADNVHHASNKCTKLFGPHWSKVTQDAMHCRGYQHCTVAEFNELLRTLQI